MRYLWLLTLLIVTSCARPECKIVGPWSYSAAVIIRAKAQATIEAYEAEAAEAKKGK